MNPTLLTLWGPLAIHAYGLCIAIGATIALVLAMRDKKLASLIKPDDLITSLQLLIFAGYVGGRIVFLISEGIFFSHFDMLVKFWEPGFSVLGSIIGVFAILGGYLYFKKISILAYLDRIALYAPLVQSFGRLGCFFAGCCYGTACNAWWAVTYTHPDHMAPLNIAIHPSQLYSSAMLLGIFLLLYFVVEKRVKTAGVIVCMYTICAGLERFLIDFFRWDRLFFNNDTHALISIHQWIGLFVSASACIMLFIILRQSKKAGH